GFNCSRSDRMRTLSGLAALVCLSPVFANGTVQFEPRGDQANIPERYRLESHSFDYELQRKRELPLTGIQLYHLRFPSPVTRDCPEHHTVHADSSRPAGTAPFPGVLALDIPAGNQDLSRGIATLLAQKKIAGLFVQMAYYGPRRPPGSKLRLLSPNVPHTLE